MSAGELSTEKCINASLDAPKIDIHANLPHLGMTMKICSRVFTNIAQLPLFLLLALPFQPAISAQTLGFVIGNFHTATHWDDRNCPKGGNGGFGRVREAAYKIIGSSPEETEELLNRPFNSLDFRSVAMRGKKDGKAVSVYYYPTSIPDPHHEIVAGPYAYGFDLDGKVKDGPYAFEDPETGQQGVDNRLYRAVGCYATYDVSLPNRPSSEEVYWSSIMSLRRVGAWVFTVTGEDLSRDGDATVRFYSAVEHMRKDASGGTFADMTYVLDPSSPTFGTFHGTISNGVFRSQPIQASDTRVLLKAKPPTYPEFKLSRAQLRLNLNADRSATGYIGGYLPWVSFWFVNGTAGEQQSIDMAGLYYNLKKLADADPDPDTGENRAISATFRVEAVPAFLATPEGHLITTSN